MTSLDHILSIINKVEKNIDAPAYLVGGGVRNFLLGEPIKDWDFATELLPDDIESNLRSSGRKPYNIGKKFGTIGFKIPGENGYQYVEITTFRNEIYDNVSRKPAVSYTDKLDEDLGRRDFTINALAMDLTGKIIDLYGGREDITNKILRAVESPKKRFREDPLRILRGIRIATELGFEIEPETFQYMSKMKFELLRIAPERYIIEIDRILKSEQVSKGLDLLMESGVLGIIIPELSLQKNYDQNSPWHDFDLWTHTKKVVSSTPRSNVNLRWAALLHDIAKPFTRTENPKGHSNYIHHDLLGSHMVWKVCKYLRFSNERTKFLVDITKHHLNPECELKVYDDMSKKQLISND